MVGQDAQRIQAWIRHLWSVCDSLKLRLRFAIPWRRGERVNDMGRTEVKNKRTMNDHDDGDGDERKIRMKGVEIGIGMT